jgi:hypothetical protein
MYLEVCAAHMRRVHVSVVLYVVASSLHPIRISSPASRMRYMPCLVAFHAFPMLCLVASPMICILASRMLCILASPLLCLLWFPMLFLLGFPMLPSLLGVLTSRTGRFRRFLRPAEAYIYAKDQQDQSNRKADHGQLKTRLLTAAADALPPGVFRGLLSVSLCVEES